MAKLLQFPTSREPGLETFPPDSSPSVMLTVGQLRQLIGQEIRAANPCYIPDKLLTPEQLAAALEVPLSWVYEQSRQGKIPTHKIGHYSRFLLSEVLDCLKKN